MSVATLLSRLSTARDNIITALGNKGVTATGHGIEDFATDIASITGGGGGTVTITDTLDSVGGTIRTITTDPAATIVEALNITQNGTYTPSSGHAYGPVVAAVAGGGGLVYETGTWIPTTAVAGANAQINFTNTHTTRPVFIVMEDATGSLTSASTTSFVLWEYVDIYLMFQKTAYPYKTDFLYGYTRTSITTSTQGGNNFLVNFSVSSDDTHADDHYYPRYFVTETCFYPGKDASSYYWQANRTYKWIAIWGA